MKANVFKWKIVAAFADLFLIWGSTYLAIRFPPVDATAAWLAALYLLVFGSLIAFTAYVWLLRATTPARASTYAYANPVVTVFLG